MANCPTCRQPASLDKDNPWRPFCSERCKLIDIGDWLSGEHRIPGESTTAPDEDDSWPDELN